MIQSDVEAVFPKIPTDGLRKAMAIVARVAGQKVSSYFINSRPGWPHLRSGVISLLGGPSGSIARSVKFDSGDDWATVQAIGTIHQFGGTIRHPGVGYYSGWNTPKVTKASRESLRTGAGKLMVFVGNDGSLVFTRRVRPHLIVEPARPYISLEDEDVKEIMDIIPSAIIGPPITVVTE